MNTTMRIRPVCRVSVGLPAGIRAGVLLADAERTMACAKKDFPARTAEADGLSAGTAVARSAMTSAERGNQ